MVDCPDAFGQYAGELKVGDEIDYYETVKPRWWQLGRKETIRHRKVEVKQVVYQGDSTFYAGDFVK